MVLWQKVIFFIEKEKEKKKEQQTKEMEFLYEANGFDCLLTDQRGYKTKLMQNGF